jgi:hypothetical protein
MHIGGFNFGAAHFHQAHKPFHHVPHTVPQEFRPFRQFPGVDSFTASVPAGEAHPFNLESLFDGADELLNSNHHDRAFDCDQVDVGGPINSVSADQDKLKSLRFPGRSAADNVDA